MAEAAQSRVQSAIKDFINQIDKVEHKIVLKNRSNHRGFVQI